MSEPSENVQSQLSAFVDNELSQDETELLSRRLSRDSEMQQRLNRYLLIGEAVRASTAQVSRDFSQRVAAAIEQQNQPVVEPTEKIVDIARHRWLKPAVGMSLAASVAALALVTVQSLQTVTDSTPAVQMASTTGIQTGTENSDVVPYATTVPSVPISATRLTNYVVAHSEFTSPLGHRNAMTGLVTGDQQTTAADTTEESVEEVVEKKVSAK